MNVYKLIAWTQAVNRGDTVDISIPIKHFEALVEIARVSDLVNAEFQSDPMSVQCFDLTAIVHPLDTALERLEAI